MSQEPTGPVTVTSLIKAADNSRYTAVVGDDRVMFAWSNHRTFFYLGEDGQPHVVAESIMRNQLDLSRFNEAAEFVNTWNHEEFNPSIILQITDDGTVAVKLRVSAPCGTGMNTAQLEHFMRTSLENTVVAVLNLIKRFPQLAVSDDEDEDQGLDPSDQQALHAPLPKVLGRLEEGAVENANRINHTQHNKEESDMDAQDQEDIPTPVTTERVLSALDHLGITNVEKDEDTSLWARINELPVGMFLDSGPTFLVVAEWSTELDPDTDLTRVFLCCNDWNDRSLTTKAYCHKTKSGKLTVRVEFSIPVAEGLTSSQLMEAAHVGIVSTLRGLSDISLNLSGKDAVSWPEE